MSMILLRFLESLPSALAVGLLLLPMLIDENGARFKKPIAILAAVRAVLGFALIVLIARSIIDAKKPIDLDTMLTFIAGTVVGKAWAATQALAILFAVLAAVRLYKDSVWLDRATLATGVAVIAVVSVTGHAIDDTFAFYTQASFFFHTAAGLTWLGGLLGLVYWMYTARGKPPEVAKKLAERWSLIAKIAMAVVAVSGVVIALENVGSFPNMLATPYGRLLTLKLIFLCAVLLFALALARYITRPQPVGADAAPFDTNWYGRIGVYESGFGIALLFLAGWIAVITPASHENDLFYPLPFRLSYIATWGQKPPMFHPIWWWGVVGLALTLAAAIIYWTPSLREKIRNSAAVSGAVAAVGALCVAVSFSTEAYTDTYNDPTVDFTAESIARGHAYFKENCTGCHGDKGDGKGLLAKDLKVPPADLTAPHVGTHTIGDIFHWLTFGGQSGVMPSFTEQLQVDDRWDVINYLLVLSSTNQSRFIGPQGMIQWLVAPDFSLVDPKEEVTTLFKLRGTPTLVSFARCPEQAGADKALDESLEIAHATALAAGANHVSVAQGACPQGVLGRLAARPKAVELAYSTLNRYPNEPYVDDIAEAHFLVDRSGYIRARFRHFVKGDANAPQLTAQVALMAKEPIVVINLHSH